MCWKEERRKNGGKSAVKKSKFEKIIDDKNDELEDKLGVEKSFINNYVGRAEINIDNIALSEKLCIPINQFKVLGIAKSMEAQFDPSLMNLTVYPADVKNFDTKNLDNNSYKIIHGNHRFLALQSLDQKGLLTSLPSLHDRTVVCTIVIVENESDVAYGNLRGNDIAAKHQRKPYLHELLFVMDSFKQAYTSQEKALEMLLRCAKVLSVHPDDITALRKLSSWKPDCFQALISVLKKFELYQTSDCKDNIDKNNRRLMEGKKAKVTVTMFKSISKCDQEYFKENSPKVLAKKLSLQNLLDNVGKDLGKKEALQIVGNITHVQSLEQLEVQFPGKFTMDVIERYEGAKVGEKPNVKGGLLGKYCKSVVNHEEIVEPVKFDTIESLSEISGDQLERFDVILMNLNEFDAGLPKTVLDIALNTTKPAMSVLILFHDEQQFTEAIKYLSIVSRPKDVVVKQVFFEVEKPKVVDGFSMNITYGVLLGKVCVLEPPVKVSNGALKKDLKFLVKKISPINAKVAFLNQGNLPIISVHEVQDEHSEVVYFGNRQSLDKFKNQKEVAVPGIPVSSEETEPKVSTAPKTVSVTKPGNCSYNYMEKMSEIEKKIEEGSSSDSSGEDDMENVEEFEETSDKEVVKSQAEPMEENSD